MTLLEINPSAIDTINSKRFEFMEALTKAIKYGHEECWQELAEKFETTRVEGVKAPETRDLQRKNR